MRSIMLSKTEYDGRMAVSLSSTAATGTTSACDPERRTISCANSYRLQLPWPVTWYNPSGADSISAMIFSASSEAPVGTAV